MTGIDYFSEPIPIALTKKKKKKCSAASKCLEERKKGFLNSSCELKRCQQKNSMESYPELDTGSRAENFNGAENVSTQCRQRGVQEEKLLGFQLTASPSPPFYKQFRHGYIVAVHKKWVAAKSFFSNSCGREKPDGPCHTSYGRPFKFYIDRNMTSLWKRVRLYRYTRNKGFRHPSQTMEKHVLTVLKEKLLTKNEFFNIENTKKGKDMSSDSHIQ